MARVVRRAPGQRGRHQVRRGHEPVGVLVVLVDADAVEAEAVGELELVEVPLVVLGDLDRVAELGCSAASPTRSRSAPRSRPAGPGTASGGRRSTSSPPPGVVVPVRLHRRRRSSGRTGDAVRRTPGSTRTTSTTGHRRSSSIGTGGPSSTWTVHPSASSSTRMREPCRCIRNVTPSHADGRLGVNRSAVPESNSPANPNDDRAPHPAGRGDVDAVAGVAVGVGEVDEQRLAEVVDGQLVVADLRRRHRLHARRQRRVAGRDRVVVVEVAALLLERELVAAQHHRQHDVGLLEHLVAVDHERVVVEQQRVVARAACPRSPTARARGSCRPAGGCRAPRRTGRYIASAASVQRFVSSSAAGRPGGTRRS